eukprot:765451-Amphidinium_carterae.1
MPQSRLVMWDIFVDWRSGRVPLLQLCVEGDTSACHTLLVPSQAASHAASAFQPAEVPSSAQPHHQACRVCAVWCKVLGRSHAVFGVGIP